MYSNDPNRNLFRLFIWRKQVLSRRMRKKHSATVLVSDLIPDLALKTFSDSGITMLAPREVKEDTEVIMKVVLEVTRSNFIPTLLRPNAG